MKTSTFRNRLSILALAAAATMFGAIDSAHAVPIVGQYLEDARCDTLPNQALRDELGQVTVFPLNEAVEVQTQATTNVVCVPQDGLANDWNVQIRNVSGQAWRDLFFVVDAGATLGNSDGTIRDVVGAPNIFTDAMRIDSLGINNNLFFESGPVNGIFDIGEVWRFNVSNFNNNAALNQPPILVTPGRFAGSSPLGTSNGNSSILANPVPEPGVISVLIGASSALLLRRPGRSRRFAGHQQ
ncbi:MAG: hypothetical protein H7Z14_04090 [Anaerolineae bacterium]|nr:hypothetical protein [Phycisphaerae bacterium]